MVHYQIGELVAVDRAALPSDHASPRPSRTRRVPSPWLAALIEGIQTTPGAAAPTRYQVRIVGDDLYGLQWPVSSCALRPWPARDHPPATAID